MPQSVNEHTQLGVGLTGICETAGSQQNECSSKLGARLLLYLVYSMICVQTLLKRSPVDSTAHGEQKFDPKLPYPLPEHGSIARANACYILRNHGT